MRITLDKSDLELITLCIELSINGIGSILKESNKDLDYYNTLTYLSTKLIVLKSYILKQR